MSKRKTPQLGTLRRRLVSLFTALTFLVMAVTGVLAYIVPFDIGIIGLHALMGFFFIVLIALHVFNNSRPLIHYIKSKALWVTLGVTAALTALFWWQPAPVKVVLGWSGNLGPAMDRFEMNENGIVFDYVPSPTYRMRLTVVPGPAYRAGPPPVVAIWLENQGGYHIKTLLEPSDARELPYWAFKHAGWENAKRDAEALGEIDAVTTATPNGSFDPADYILPPASSGESSRFSLLIEINQPGDGQPSLVHAVEINNRLPQTYQLLDLIGYPKRGENDDGKEEWSLYFIDSTISSALDLIDSALLTIVRE